MSLEQKLTEVLGKIDELNFDREEDRRFLKEMIKGVLYYKRIIPKSLESLIVRCIDICVAEKIELDYLRALYKADERDRPGVISRLSNSFEKLESDSFQDLENIRFENLK